MSAMDVVLLKPHDSEEPSTQTITQQSVPQSVFQVHGIDAEGKVIIRRQVKRRYLLAFFEKLPPCLVGIEAGASSHHGRVNSRRGHTVRLMPPAYVKRQKNDAADAEAICEAAIQPTMRFVETKTPEQSCLMLHRTRQLFIHSGSAQPVTLDAKRPLSNAWRQIAWSS